MKILRATDLLSAERMEVRRWLDELGVLIDDLVIDHVCFRGTYPHMTMYVVCADEFDMVVRSIVPLSEPPPSIVTTRWSDE